MKLVYLSGPITNGHRLPLHEQLENVRFATELAAEFMHKGLAVICPHWSLLGERLAHMRMPYETWINTDLEIIRRCDALYRIPGESKGATMEAVEAYKLGIPVFRTQLALYEWAGISMGNRYQEKR